MEGIQKGPFDPTRLGKADFHSRILYPQCRTTVMAPHGFNSSLALRSAKLPQASLRLDFVYGYNGLNNLSSNVFFSSTREIIYFTAGVAVAYNAQSHTQRFFLGHSDDISSMAMHPNRSLVATGQVGRDPYICIWEAATGTEVSRLSLGRGHRAALALAFSSDGRRLAVVAGDNQHTVTVWLWRNNGKCLAEAKGHNGTPPQVYGVIWNPYDEVGEEFLTYGVNHIKVWRRAEGDRGGDRGGQPYQHAGMTFGKLSEPFPVLCLCFLSMTCVAAGTPDGRIAIFREKSLVALIPAHKDLGERMVAGLPSSRGLRCLTIVEHGRVLVSGGADGRLVLWEVRKGSFTGTAVGEIQLKGPFEDSGEDPAKVRGLDWVPHLKGRKGAGTFVIGTSRCEIWHADAARLSASPLMFGHAADVSALCFNPTRAHVFCTGAGQRLLVWDGKRRRLLRTALIGCNGSGVGAVSWSADGRHIVVGTLSGGIKVFDAQSLEVLVWRKERDLAIEVMAYSPNGRFLAAGGHDAFIDVHDVREGYKRISRCVGHSATIRHLDWSADSTTIQSNCSGYERLCWAAGAGELHRQPQRDYTAWHSWTCVLGFPVMGIWPPGSDGTDINSCCCSMSGDILVTADDFGKVNLLNYPCIVGNAPARSYNGHSSHVMFVRFSPDDRFVVSLGGKDRALFQWSTQYIAQEMKVNRH